MEKPYLSPTRGIKARLTRSSAWGRHLTAFAAEPPARPSPGWAGIRAYSPQKAAHRGVQTKVVEGWVGKGRGGAVRGAASAVAGD